MKKLVVLLCCLSVIGCFSCKKSCSCEYVTVENSTGNVISTRYEGSYKIDRNTSCDMLANDMTAKNSGTGAEAFTWLLAFVITGNPFAGIPAKTTHSYYQCTPE